MADIWLEEIELIEREAPRVFAGKLGALDPRWRILELCDRKDAHAYLITSKVDGTRLALPLRNGLTIVGRSEEAEYVDDRTALVGVVEGSQWLVSISPSRCSIRDADSTNGAVVVPRALRENAPAPGKHFPKAEFDYLGWDGSVRYRESAELFSGDVLVNAYARFVFYAGL